MSTYHFATCPDPILLPGHRGESVLDQFLCSRDQFTGLLEEFESKTGQPFNIEQTNLLFESFKFLSPDEIRAEFDNLILSHAKRGYTIADLYLPIMGKIADRRKSTWEGERAKRLKINKLCRYCDSTGVMEAAHRADKNILAFACTFCDIAEKFRKLGSLYVRWNDSRHRRSLYPLDKDNAMEVKKRIFAVKKNEKEESHATIE